MERLTLTTYLDKKIAEEGVDILPGTVAVLETGVEVDEPGAAPAGI